MGADLTEVRDDGTRQDLADENETLRQELICLQYELKRVRDERELWRGKYLSLGGRQ